MALKTVTIEYCTSWNYYPRAAGLADELKQKFGIQPQLVRSYGGVFEVSVDNELIFSKKKTGRFPSPGEVVRTLEQRPDAPSASGS